PVGSRILPPLPPAGEGWGGGHRSRILHSTPPQTPKPIPMTFNQKRRDALKAAAFAAMAGGAGFAPGSAQAMPAVRRTSSSDAGPAAAPAGDSAWDALRLWYPRPATQWVEALPLGKAASARWCGAAASTS